MEFQPGSVLERAIKITLSKFVPLLAISLIVYAPVILLVLLLLGGATTTRSLPIGPDGEIVVQQANTGLAAFVGILALFAGFVVTAALTHAVFQTLRQRPIEIPASLAVGFKRALPVLGVSILFGLCVGIGFLLLIVPGLILLCVLYVAVPAVVVERPGVFGALGRSADLTKGNRWGILILVLVFFGIGIVVNLVTRGSATEGAFAVIVAQLLGMLVNLFSSVSQVVAYHDLRAAKEGISTEEIASVFD